MKRQLRWCMVLITVFVLINNANAQTVPKLETNAKDTITVSEMIQTGEGIGDAIRTYKVIGGKHAFRLHQLNIHPQYPVGERKFRDTLRSKVWELYPNNDNSPVRVQLTFVIGYDGELRDFKIWSIRPSADKKLIRFIKSLPRWKPGIKNKKYALSLYEIAL